MNSVVLCLLSYRLNIAESLEELLQQKGALFKSKVS